MRTKTFLSHDVSVHPSVRALCTPPVGHNGSPSAVNETNCNKQEAESLYPLIKINMSPTSCWTCPSPTKSRLTRSAISCIAVEILVVQFLHLIHDGDFFLSESAARKPDRSRIGAFLPNLFNVRYHCPWNLLNSSLERQYV